MRQWRVIYDQPTTGARNMARDEAILKAVSSGESPPTLRFYDWHPACLSLGYGQRAREADLDRLHARGWDIVRRATGGRAILHVDEVTYSLALPIDHPLAAGGVIESYRRISTGLAAGLRSLGLQIEAAQIDGDVPVTPVCFETPSHYEITFAGRKLIGSAQVRRRNGLLQHGSLPLYGDLTRICDALVYPDEDARTAAKYQLTAHALTLAEALGGNALDWQTVADALAWGFTAAFDVSLARGELTPGELADADRFENEMYGCAEWTFRR